MSRFEYVSDLNAEMRELWPSQAQVRRMHVGKLVFAQLMDHLPWKTFGRIVERYGGDQRVRDSAVPISFVAWPSRS